MITHGRLAMNNGKSHADQNDGQKNLYNYPPEIHEREKTMPDMRKIYGRWEMTTDDVRRVLKSPHKPLALCALSYVNLTDRELNLLILRHMRGHTQEETAEETGYSVAGIQKQEYAALEKCRKAWEKLIFVQELLIAAEI